MASDTIQYPNKKNLSSKLSREKKEKKKKTLIKLHEETWNFGHMQCKNKTKLDS